MTKAWSIVQAIFRSHRKLWIVVISILAGIAVLYGIAAYALNSYLSSPGLQDQLSGKAAEKLNAESGFLPLSWNGLSVHSGGFAARSPRHEGITKIQVAGIDAHCGITSLWHGSIAIYGLYIKHLQVATGEAAAGKLVNELSPQPEMKQPGKSGKSYTVDVRHTLINSLDLFWGDKPDSVGGLKSVLVNMRTMGKDLDVEGKGGDLVQSGIPDLHINRLHLYYSKPDLFIKESDLHFAKEDHVSITGQLSFKDKSEEKLDFKFDDCPVHDFLPKDWQKKFRGAFSSRSKVAMISSDKSTLEIEGDFDISDAVLQGMAAQKKLASLTHKPEFERLAFDKLRCDFTYKKNTLKVTKFEARVKSLFIVEGSFELRKEEIDANLKVGVAPSVIKGIPGASEKVFTEASGGYLWTHVKVTGTLKHPHEDLTPRLVTAAKEQILGSILRIPTAPEILVFGILARLFDE